MTGTQFYSEGPSDSRLYFIDEEHLELNLPRTVPRTRAERRAAVPPIISSQYICRTTEATLASPPLARTDAIVPTHMPAPVHQNEARMCVARIGAQRQPPRSSLPRTSACSLSCTVPTHTGTSKTSPLSTV